MKPTPRKILLQVHLWAGLIIGLVLVVQAFSGAMLAWRPQLEPKLNARLFVVQPGGARLAPDDLVARARAAHPAGKIESVRYYGEETSPFIAYFSTRDYVHLNPYTGEVLGFRKRYGESFGWFEGIHKFLQLEPGIGEPITGSVALVFGGIILTGVVLWWPATRRAFKAGLTLNAKLSGRPWYLSLHKTVGAYAAIVVFASVLTGAPIALDWVNSMLYPLTASKKEEPPQPALAPDKAFAGFTTVARKIEALMPGAREVYISMPKKGVVTSYVVAADAPHPNARSYGWFNPADAAVLRFIPYAQASRGYRLYYWMLSFHTGMIGGWLVQVMLFLGALAVPVLAYTGTSSYLRRKYGRLAAQAAKAPVAPPVKLAQSGETAG